MTEKGSAPAAKPEEQIAAAKAAAKAAAPKVALKAPDGVTSVSVGGEEIKVPKGGTIKVGIEHIEALIAHGFEFVVAELEKL